MSLVNVAYATTYGWGNPTLLTLEQQAVIPMMGQDPVELGVSGHQQEILERLRQDDLYQTLFAEAFPGEDDPFTLDHVIAALASFQRTLISVNSAFDRYVFLGDDQALSASALRGYQLFNSEKMECFHCHGGLHFTDSSTHEGKVFDESAFHNTNLYNVDGMGAYPEGNQGVHDVTGDDEDRGRFKAPTLRNIAVTAPYMHDGSLQTLQEVLDHYAAGGRAGQDGQNPNKSSFVSGFELSDQERADLIAFLESLTDEDFLTDPRLSDPFP
jgi:cytochrome c peroxidase